MVSVRLKLVFALLVMAIASGCPSQKAQLREDLEWRLRDSINRVRAENGLAPLTINLDLRTIARAHNEQMVIREMQGDTDAFDHRDANGMMVEDRLESYRTIFGKKTIDWVEAGENLARNRNFEDPVAESVRCWLESPHHRKNILSPRFKETGIAVHQSPTTRNFYLTQVFARLMPQQ